MLTSWRNPSAVTLCLCKMLSVGMSFRRVRRCMSRSRIRLIRGCYLCWKNAGCISCIAIRRTQSERCWQGGMLWLSPDGLRQNDVL